MDWKRYVGTLRAPALIWDEVAQASYRDNYCKESHGLMAYM